jgi:ORF6N domain-containing protein
MSIEYSIIPVERIQNCILLIRGQKVMLDRDLAALYRVETRVLNQAVQRNINRFPGDFMFELTREEIMRISQIVTSSDIKYSKRVCAFTEQGVAMLSSVLHSARAVSVNIEIMRAFVKLRQLLSTHTDLARKLEVMEKRYDTRFKVVFEALRQLMRAPEPPGKKIGFHVRERNAAYRTRKNGVR